METVDRHRLWRIVANNYEGLERMAPEGYVPAVDVFLAGREAPIRLARVETSRNPNFGWVFLVAESEQFEVGVATPEDLVVFVPEHAVMRVEIHLARRGKRTTGFVYSDSITADSPSADA